MAEHHHENTPFPDISTDPSMLPPTANFLHAAPDNADVGQFLRPHVGHENNMRANAELVSRVARRHSPDRAQALGTVIMAILRSPWWNANTHFPTNISHPHASSPVDPFDELVEGPKRKTCTLCGSSNGKACVKYHLAYGH
ncbi:hypothetical protein PIIN_06506 [Serendipita indica DSM 11827]|uniref:Uncharacterized protein n=1 Tax=Serendipita indica (strain DSM 11827) TaxID=1109443 RepID=G4TMM6_SERID|nr:hypothetical protein PIIN_06506 [Serendipita indica DSM 11827]